MRIQWGIQMMKASYWLATLKRQSMNRAITLSLRLILLGTWSGDRINDASTDILAYSVIQASDGAHRFSWSN